MPILEVQTPDGETMRIQQEQGFNIPDEMVQKVLPAKDVKLQLQWMKEMDVRDDDIMICAYPKAGTHWLWEVLSMLSKEHTQYEKNAKEAAMIEFCTKEQVASLPSPRVLNTHYTPYQLPDGFIDRKCKIINVMRNPKDICVSWYCHHRALKAKAGVNVTGLTTFSHHMQKFISPLAVPCNYFWYIKELEKFKKENPDYPVINIFYEDMKKHPEIEIQKLGTFLGKEVSDELASDIAEKCKFDSLKKANEHKTGHPKSQQPSKEQKEDNTKAEQPSSAGKSWMYRKGHIGDWKNHFTVADNELFDKWIEEESKDTDIKFRYE